MSEPNFALLNRSAFSAIFTPVPIGLSEEIVIDLKLVTDPIRTGTTGKVILGTRVLGIEGSIKIPWREISQAGILAMAPWNGGTVPGGGIQLCPPANTDLYQYAQLLRLHPTTATDNSMDIVLIKAAP